jgi:hypothetical protein
MHICFKIIKFLLYSTLLYMFRTLLCPSSRAFHHCTCSLQPCSVVTAVGSNNRTGLEDATNTRPHGNQRLHVQWWKAPDDGHSSVRNMYSNVEYNKNFMILKQMCIWLVLFNFMIDDARNHEREDSRCSFISNYCCCWAPI